MNKDVLSFTNIEINHDLLNEIWRLDPRTLEHIDGQKLSSYALCLAQYLVYFTYQRNLSKAEQHRLHKYIDRTVSIIMTTNNENPEFKKIKTKAALADFIVSTNMELMEAQAKLETIQQELLQIEGMDKTISELIATIKRELTRRENELYQVRMERR
jgi:hypothetical protein